MEVERHLRDQAAVAAKVALKVAVEHLHRASAAVEDDGLHSVPVRRGAQAHHAVLQRRGAHAERADVGHQVSTGLRYTAAAHTIGQVPCILRSQMGI